MIYSLIMMVAALASVQAACDNQCSGHGSCEVDDVCQCYDNWGVGLSKDSGDCSDRICPFELAWVETPVTLLSGVGHFHRYAECANRGVCDRSSGNCECFDGYEGKGCQRTTCPNDCSGHGTCEYIEDMRYRAVWADYVNVGRSVDVTAPFAKHFHVEREDSRGTLNNASTRYNYYPESTFRSLPAKIPFHDWDLHKTRGCVCDAQYADIDCSKRMCPYGTDVLDVRDNLFLDAKYQTQSVSIFESFGDVDTTDPYWEEGKTFALTFKSKINETFTTVPISLDYVNLENFETDIRLALISLPNHVVDDVTVKVITSADTTTEALAAAYHMTLIQVTFSGNAVQGKQNLLTVESFECQNGCTPKVTGLLIDTKVSSEKHSNITQQIASDYHSFECGRRGKCDYGTGLCGCFEGYSGDNCNQQTILV